MWSSLRDWFPPSCKSEWFSQRLKIKTLVKVEFPRPEMLLNTHQWNNLHHFSVKWLTCSYIIALFIHLKFRGNFLLCQLWWNWLDSHYVRIPHWKEGITHWVWVGRTYKRKEENSLTSNADSKGMCISRQMNCRERRKKRPSVTYYSMLYSP